MSHRAIDTLALLAGLTLFGCADSSTNDGTTGVVDENLAAFDQLDFDAYNKQDWDLFRHIHCSDVVVTNYDGSQTQGIDAHVAAIAYQFTWAPDSRAVAHPVKVGQGEWTAVQGHIQGTFSQPMALQDGTMIPPTGKSFDSTMATFARWENGCIAEEQLFLDLGTITKQIGISQ